MQNLFYRKNSPDRYPNSWWIWAVPCFSTSGKSGPKSLTFGNFSTILFQHICTINKLLMRYQPLLYHFYLSIFDQNGPKIPKTSLVPDPKHFDFLKT